MNDLSKHAWTTEYITLNRVPTATRNIFMVCPRTQLKEHRIDGESWNLTISSIEQMLWIGDDWDGANGKSPSEAVINSAVRYAARLRDQGQPPPVRTVPTGAGSVIMEWQSENAYCQIEISRPGIAEVYFSQGNRLSTYKEVDFGDDLRESAISSNGFTVDRLTASARWSSDTETALDH
jgi:hypothetical protein